MNHIEDIIGISIAGAPDNPASLANFLTAEIGRPVVDKTGLQGRYDVHLEWNLAATEGTTEAEALGDRRVLTRRSSLPYKTSSG